MDVILRSDWATRLQAAAACGAICFIGAIVFGAF